LEVIKYIIKIHKFISKIIKCFLKGEFALFFHEITGYFPRWLLKVNSGIIFKTSSPQIKFRKYKNYIFLKATGNDIVEISLITNIRETELKRRLNMGDSCYFVKDITNNDKIVNIIWVHRGSCYIKGLGFDLELPYNSAYLYGGFTTQEARMKGIFNTALKIVYDTLVSQGIPNIYGLVESWNRSAYNYHLRLNFKPVGKITFFIILFIKASIYTNLEIGRKKIKVFLFFPKNRALI